MDRPHCAYPLIHQWTPDCFHLSPVFKSRLWIQVCDDLFKTLLSVWGWVCLEVGVQDHVVILFTSQEAPLCFPQHLHHYTSQPAVHKSFYFSTSSPTLCLEIALPQWEWSLTVILIGIFLTSDITFSCTLWACVSLWRNIWGGKGCLQAGLSALSSDPSGTRSCIKVDMCVHVLSYTYNVPF